MKAVPYFFRLATALSFAATAAAAAPRPPMRKTPRHPKPRSPPAVRPLILSASSIR